MQSTIRQERIETDSRKSSPHTKARPLSRSENLKSIKPPASAPENWHQALARLFLASRAAPRFGRIEAVALVLFGIVAGWCSAAHVSWFDETQAWLIAKNSSLPDLLMHRLHYEGSPGLWHLLLWMLSRVGAPFAAVHALAALAAIAGAAVWFIWNPLPRIPALLMPFTYFFLFQYAVVARSYSLAPLLAFVLMAIYGRRASHPMLFALIAGLFANASVHMAALATGLAFAYGIDRLRPHASSHKRLASLTPAAALFTLSLLVAAAQAFPTADGSSTSANPLVIALRHSSPSGAAPGTALLSNADALSASQRKLTQGSDLAARVRRLLAGDPSAAIFGLHPNPRLVRHLLVFLNAFTVPISTSNGVSLAFFLLLAISLAAARRLELLLPWLFVQTVNVLVTGEAHHLGLLWIALACALWGLAAHLPAAGLPRLVWNLTLLFLVGIETAQIFWSAHAVASDLRAPYSPSMATARFFQSLPAGTRIAAFDDDSVTVNAYLPHSPYFNHTTDYWPFSKSRNPDNRIIETMAQHPDLVSIKMSIPDQPALEQWVSLSVPGTEYVAPGLLALLEADGYRQTHRFCGRRYFRDRSEGLDCRLIYAPSENNSKILSTARSLSPDTN